jgi:cytoskeletal protein CcmA (bactofilin family)
MPATNPDDRSATAIPSLVGPGTSIDGEVAGDGDLLVRGRIHGRVTLGGSLTVESTGSVEADVTAGGTVRLEADSRVAGDIRAPRVVIVDGASFRGTVDTSGEALPPGPPGT